MNAGLILINLRIQNNNKKSIQLSCFPSLNFFLKITRPHYQKLVLGEKKRLKQKSKDIFHSHRRVLQKVCFMKIRNWVLFPYGEPRFYIQQYFTRKTTQFQLNTVEPQLLAGGTHYFCSKTLLKGFRISKSEQQWQHFKPPVQSTMFSLKVGTEFEIGIINNDSSALMSHSTEYSAPKKENTNIFSYQPSAVGSGY